jgi:hypothetical protein
MEQSPAYAAQNNGKDDLKSIREKYSLSRICTFHLQGVGVHVETLLDCPVCTYRVQCATSITHQQNHCHFQPQGVAPPPSLSGAKAGSNHLNPPPLPIGIGERNSQTISNLCQAALLCRYELPLIVLN